VGERSWPIVADTRARPSTRPSWSSWTTTPSRSSSTPKRRLKDEIVLFPEVGTNIASRVPATDAGDAFDACDVVVETRMLNPRMAPAPLEVRTAASVWGEDGRLTQWSCTRCRTW